MKLTPLLTALAALWLNITPAMADGGVGIVKELTGTATVTQAGGASAQLVLGASVYAQDVIKTAPQSRVKVVFNEGTEAVLSGHGELHIDDFSYNPDDETQNKARLGFVGGAFSYVSGLVAKKKDPDVKINTDFGSIGIRGTRFIGALKNNLNWVYVDKGEVEFTNSGGSVVIAHGNGTSIRSATDAPRPPYLWGEDEINWLQRAVDDPAAQDTPAMVARLEEQKQVLARQSAPAAANEVGGGAPAAPAAARPAQPAAEASAPASLEADSKAVADEAPSRARVAGKTASIWRSITPPDIAKKAADAGGASKFTTEKPATFLLAEADPAVLQDSDGLLEFNLLMKAEELQGSAYLELRVHTAGVDGPESYARNLDTQLVKAGGEWQPQAVQFELKDGVKPDKITCSLVINGKGTILVKDPMLRVLPK
jgi:hypothetical protein